MLNHSKPLRQRHGLSTAGFRIKRSRRSSGSNRLGSSRTWPEWCVRDVGLAEELAQDALVSALSEWPKIGIPRNPGAWLMAATKRRAIDGFCRNKMLARKHTEIGRDLEDERDRSGSGLAQLCSHAGGEGGLPVPGEPAS
jgi:hypothetical protein